MADLEVEEGEILDSDDNTPQDAAQSTVEEKKTENLLFKDSGNVQAVQISSHSYRQASARQVNSDYDSNTSDEDTDLWKCKKAKYFSNSREKAMELSNEICSPPRPIKPVIASTEHMTHVQATRKRKVNNIWGSVLTEQSLTKGLTGVSVDKPEEDSDQDDRDVEKYDYTKKYEDTRPNLDPRECLPDIHNPFEEVIESCEVGLTVERELRDVEGRIEGRGRKRKKNPKDRLGEMQVDTTRDRKHINAREEDSEKDVVHAITKFLDEPNEELFTRIVNTVGNKKSLELTYLTEDVENAGGLLTHDGVRRRTPGGVFIQLLKKDKHVTKEQVKEIFAEEERKFKEHLKRKRKEKRKRHKQLVKNLPQTKYMQKKDKKSNNSKEVGMEESAENSHHSDTDNSSEEEMDNGDNTAQANTDSIKDNTDAPKIQAYSANDFVIQTDDVIDLGTCEDYSFD